MYEELIAVPVVPGRKTVKEKFAPRDVERAQFVAVCCDTGDKSTFPAEGAVEMLKGLLEGFQSVCLKSEKGGNRRGGEGREGKEEREAIHSLLCALMTMSVYMALSVPLSIFL